MTPKMRKEISKMLEGKLPFLIVLDKKFAKKHELSRIFAFIQMPEALENIHLKVQGLRLFSWFRRFRSCECEDFTFCRITEIDIPYKKIKKVVSLPSELIDEDPTEVFHYLCDHLDEILKL